MRVLIKMRMDVVDMPYDNAANTINIVGPTRIIDSFFFKQRDIITIVQTHKTPIAIILIIRDFVTGYGAKRALKFTYIYISLLFSHS